MHERMALHAGLTTPVLVAAIGASGAFSGQALARVPFFATLSSEPATLQAYSAPVHVDVTLHKLFRFRLGLDGTISFKQPDRIALSMSRVPPKYQRLFGDLGTPRTWPLTYDLHVAGSHSEGGRLRYQIVGTPRRPSDIERMTAEVSDETTPVYAKWFLRDGGTIELAIESQAVGDYLLPKREEGEIAVDGFKIHCVMQFGPYALNDRSIASE